jgi:hypothetical protein
MYLRYTGRPEGRLAIVGWLVGFSLWLIEQTEGQKQRTMFPLARANYSEPPELKTGHQSQIIATPSLSR